MFIKLLWTSSSVNSVAYPTFSKKWLCLKNYFFPSPQVPCCFVLEWHHTQNYKKKRKKNQSHLVNLSEARKKITTFRFVALAAWQPFSENSGEKVLNGCWVDARLLVCSLPWWRVALPWAKTVVPTLFFIS